MSRSRGYCFTINNYTEEDRFNVANLITQPGFQYFIVGTETGEGGTPHLQGYCYFKTLKTRAQLSTALPRAHLEVQRGSFDQAIEYCKKGGDFTETGTRPCGSTQEARDRGGATNKRRYEEALASAKTGSLDQIEPDLLVRHYRTFKEIKKDFMERVNDLDDVCGVWYYGPPGTGKSYSARQNFKGAYEKMPNKWFDGYQNEDAFIIDDLGKDHVYMGYHLKIWSDRYAYIAETKGGAIRIRPKTVVITSNYTIDEIWTDEAMCSALQRRFKVTHFSDFFDRNQSSQ